MKIKIQNNVLATGEIQGYTLTADAQKELVEKLVGAKVYFSEKTTNLFIDRSEATEIGFVSEIDGDNLILEIDADGFTDKYLSNLSIKSKANRNKSVSAIYSVEVCLVPPDLKNG